MNARHDVMFPSGRQACAGWWFTARTTANTAPCVVMAHGFSMTRGDGLAAYAEAFADAGAHVLAFDYRFLGDSSGSRRQRIRVSEQLEDWRNALAFARLRPSVDPTKIVMWGFSFTGGHIAVLLGKGETAAAAVLQCPLLDGIRFLLAADTRTALRVLPRAVLDMVGFHNTIAVAPPPDAPWTTALNQDFSGFADSATEESGWVNAVTPGFMLTMLSFRPIRYAAAHRVPMWVGRCLNDASVDRATMARFADQGDDVTRHEMPGDHFAPFRPRSRDLAITAQLSFLRQHGLLAPRVDE